MAAGTLEILHKLLTAHDVRLEDFIDEPCVDCVQPVSGACPSATPALMSKPPGHTILVHLTSDSATLRTVGCLAALLPYIITYICSLNYMLSTELLYADDLVVIAETEEDLIKRLNEWKDFVENRGMRVNMN